MVGSCEREVSQHACDPPHEPDMIDPFHVGGNGRTLCSTVDVARWSRSDKMIRLWFVRACLPYL